MHEDCIPPICRLNPFNLTAWGLLDYLAQSRGCHLPHGGVGAKASVHQRARIDYISWLKLLLRDFIPANVVNFWFALIFIDGLALDSS